MHSKPTNQAEYWIHSIWRESQMGTDLRRKASQRTQFFRLKLASCAVMLPLIALQPSVTYIRYWKSTPAVTVIETTQLVGFGEAKYPPTLLTSIMLIECALNSAKWPAYGNISTYDSFIIDSAPVLPLVYSGEIYTILWCFHRVMKLMPTIHCWLLLKFVMRGDFSWMEIDINPNAKFHDGQSISPWCGVYLHEIFDRRCASISCVLQRHRIRYRGFWLGCSYRDE